MELVHTVFRMIENVRRVGISLDQKQKNDMSEIDKYTHDVELVKRIKFKTCHVFINVWNLNPKTT